MKTPRKLSLVVCLLHLAFFLNVALVFGSMPLYGYDNHALVSEGNQAAQARVFSTKSFGAVGDCVAMETEAVHKAVDACHAAGGGVVWIPAGDYQIATIQIKSHVTLSLDYGASLLGSINPADYPTEGLDQPREGGPRCLIYAKDIEFKNVEMTLRNPDARKKIVLDDVEGFADLETLAPLAEGKSPQTHDALWVGFDPQAEPLDVEVLKEWEDDGVVLKVLRYRIGIFKGQKAMMAAVYGYPKGEQNLPGLVQIHGGGQYAHSNAVFTNAKRGYATISISWAGRIDAPGYRVTPDVVKLFWQGKTDDPQYKLTTDWGALDAYHAPTRNPKSGFAHVAPQPWTLDEVDSPRNNPWFLCTLGARRALTFLEQQPQVDSDKLGVYGHSMGGKLTVLTTGSDDRVKAAAPSCGGISNRDGDTALFRATIGDDAYLKHIACPIMFLSPANDFHGRINDLQTALTEIKTNEWRVTCAAHHNHQDTDNYEVATQLWFDEHLKGTFQFPKTPRTTLVLDTKSGVPSFRVSPDEAKSVVSVDIFYTQQGRSNGSKDDRNNTIARFWHHAAAVQKDGQWTGELPLLSTGKPLWVYANVVYPLDEPVTGAGYYYGTYTAKRYNLSSKMAMVTPEELQAADVKATLQSSLMIETFAGDWEKEWFTYKPEDMQRKTHKLYDPQWAAPAGARLAIEVLSEEVNKFVVGLDAYAAEIQLEGSSNWEQVVLSPEAFRNAEGETLQNWQGLMELRLGDRDTLRGKDRNQRVNLGARWQGKEPTFRNLQWITMSTAGIDDWIPEPGFVSLFNGKDLSGWCFRAKTAKGETKPGAVICSFEGMVGSSDNGRYSAKDGILKVNFPNGKDRLTGQIHTVTEFPENFVLKLEFRASKNADSGIFIRKPQLQCRDYLVAGPYKALKQYRPQDWNLIEVSVKEGVAYCTCNGEVLEAALRLPKTGPIGLEGDRGQMEYRHLQLKKLPPQD